MTVRSSCHFEEGRGDSINIVFTSIPYQVTKSTIIERIVDLVRKGRARQDRQLDSIRDLRDESDRDGLRLVVELKQHAQPQRVLNHLYRYTPLQGAYSIQMLALVDGEPRTLSLKRCLRVYIEHRREVIARRSQHDLKRQRARAHVLIGLLKAVANIDAVIQTIRSSPDVDAARASLMTNFELDERQANAILDMQLRRLAALERQKLQEEHTTVQARIEYLDDLLASPKKVLRLIRDDIQEIADKYGDERKTEVVYGNIDFDEGELYRKENVVISLSAKGYIKRVAARLYRQQKRGGKGMRGMKLKDDDALLDVFFAYSHDTILFFSDRGRVYSCLAYEIAESTRERRGMLVQGMLPLEGDERITAIFALPDEQADDESGCFVLATEGGKVKRVDQSEFMGIRPSGLVAITLLPGDSLRWVKRTNGDQQVLMATAGGQCIMFHESDVRVMGRGAAGVKGIDLRDEDRVVSMDVIDPADTHVLVTTQKGKGKLTPLGDYRVQARAGLGLLTQRVTDDTGPVVAVRSVRHGDKLMLMLMTEKGKVLRTQIAEISQIGRLTQGVKLMNIADDDEVAGIAIMRGDEDPETPELEPADAEEAARYNGNLL